MSDALLSVEEVNTSLDLHFGPIEPLCDELRRCVSVDPRLGPTLRHPLVNLPLYHDRLAKFANNALAAKREAVRKAEAEGRITSAVFLHERPWRLSAMIERLHMMVSAGRGKLIAEVWRDSEFPHRNLSTWRMLWGDPAHQRSAMTSKERLRLDSLQRSADRGKLVLWRGTGKGGAAMRGLSWTTDRAKAEWFASRFSDRAFVWEARPGPERLWAYQEGRGESEVIVDVRGLRGIIQRHGGAGE